MLISIIKRNRLRKHFFHHMTVDICETSVDTILAPGQLGVVDTQEVQNRCMDTERLHP